MVRSGAIENFNAADLLLLGADVKALFPSLDCKEVAKEVMKELLETEMKIDEVDWKELATYLAMNLDQKQVDALPVRRLIPVRRYSRGPRPGCTGKDARDRNVKEADTKWEFKPSQEPYLWETKYLLAASIQIAVEVTFSNYLYSFGGTT